MTKNDIDSLFINYLFSSRKRRKIKHADDIHEVYTKKYSKWIINYLKWNNIRNAPVFIACNTLYKLPDYFRINENSFFVGDYALYNYLYDWNYFFDKNYDEDYMILLCLKQCMESLYLKKDIDRCYLLCSCTNGLESYKNKEYYCSDVIIQLSNLTDIQEAFIFVHEATHYLLDIDFLKYESSTQIQKYENFCKIHKKDKFIDKLNNVEDQKKLFVECICDEQAVKYIMDNITFDDSITTEIFCRLIFRTMFCLYVMKYIDFAVSGNIVDNEYGFNDILWEITYRFGNIYITLAELFSSNNYNMNIENLNSIYEEQVNILQNEMKKVRRIINSIGLFLIENDELMMIVNKTDKKHKQAFLKEYLALLE